MLIWTREEHPLKQRSPMNVTEFGISNSVSALQLSRHEHPISLTELGIFNFFKE
jgi:hypothetical protein